MSSILSKIKDKVTSSLEAGNDKPDPKKTEEDNKPLPLSEVNKICVIPLVGSIIGLTVALVSLCKIIANVASLIFYNHLTRGMPKNLPKLEARVKEAKIEQEKALDTNATEQATYRKARNLYREALQKHEANEQPSASTPELGHLEGEKTRTRKIYDKAKEELQSSNKILRTAKLNHFRIKSLKEARTNLKSALKHFGIGILQATWIGAIGLVIHQAKCVEHEPEP